MFYPTWIVIICITDPISDIRLFPIFITVIRSLVINVSVHKALFAFQVLRPDVRKGNDWVKLHEQFSSSYSSRRGYLPVMLTQHGLYQLSMREPPLCIGHTVFIFSLPFLTPPFTQASPSFHPNPYSRSQRPGEGMDRAELIAFRSFFSYYPVAEAKPPRALEL